MIRNEPKQNNTKLTMALRSGKKIKKKTVLKVILCSECESTDQEMGNAGIPDLVTSETLTLQPLPACHNAACRSLKCMSLHRRTTRGVITLISSCPNAHKGMDKT